MKEGKTRRRVVVCTIAVGGVLISAAAIALYTPWLGLFDLREIVISGNQRVSAETIGRAAALRRGHPLLAISLSNVSTRVSSLPWIKAVAVRRDFPHGIRIRVQERAPIAWMQHPEGAECLTVGEGGVVVATGCETWDTLVELTGGSVSSSAPGARLLDERVADLIERLRSDDLSTMHIQRIDVTDPSSVTLDAESGLRVMLGGIELQAKRVSALAALSRAIDLIEYRLIDLRLEGEARLVTW